MKTILALLTTLALAAPALATETADMVPGGAPASRCAIGTESGTTWTGNDASNPIYCSLTSGGFSSSGLATAANQTTTNTSIGATNETAASTDTATSGLNGRLQRIAQRLTALLALDPGKCSNPWITTIDTTSGADTSLALTGCVSETCKRVVVDNVGSNPVLIQVNSSTGTSGIWLAGATAHPEMMHSVDLSFGPAVTAIYKSTTGATAPAAYGTTGASETVVTACD